MPRTLREILRKFPESLAPPLLVTKSEISSAQSPTPIPTTLKLQTRVQFAPTAQFSREYQMTIRTKITTLNRKQATILATVLWIDQVKNGVDFVGYLLTEYLHHFLSGSREPEEIGQVYERRAVLMLRILLSHSNGNWINMGEREMLPSEVLVTIPSDWLPSERTYASWSTVYQLEKWFEARIVPLDLLIEERQIGTERYSGYTKGYGNGGRRSSTEKTPYDSELDGASDDPDRVRVNLLEFEQFNTILLAIEKAKASKRDKENRR